MFSYIHGSLPVYTLYNMNNSVLVNRQGDVLSWKIRGLFVDSCVF